MKKTILLLLTLTLVLVVFVSCDKRYLNIDDQTSALTSVSQDTSDSETTFDTTATSNAPPEYTDDPLSKGSPKDTELDTSTLPPIPSENLQYKTVILPVSKKEVRLERRHFALWETVNQELLEKADQKILDETEKYNNNNYSLSFGENNGELFLSAEFIVDIDPPQTVVDRGEILYSGCDIDHKHVLVKGQITCNNIK